MTSETLARLAELEGQSTPGPWETVNHETSCFNPCTPNGCPGHDTGVAYNIDGPMLLRDGEPPSSCLEMDRLDGTALGLLAAIASDQEKAKVLEAEEKAAFHQADVDSKFISLFRQHAHELIETAQKEGHRRQGIKQAITAIENGRKSVTAVGASYNQDFGEAFVKHLKSLL